MFFCSHLVPKVYMGRPAYSNFKSNVTCVSLSGLNSPTVHWVHGKLDNPQLSPLAIQGAFSF